MVKSVRSLSLLLVGAPLVFGYTPPDGPDNFHADLNKPMAHGTIVLKAIEILRNDGFAQMADLFQSRRQELLNGNRQADHGGGAVKFSGVIDLSFLPNPLKATFVLFEAELPANTMSHFYNPDTGEGLTLFKRSGPLSTLVELFNSTPLEDYRLDSLVGPHPPATDMCDLFYAKAVDEMRKGHIPEAMTFLGTAIHYVADLTVPQHATDLHNGYPGAKHADYEKFCDGYLATVRHALSGSDLGTLYTNGAQFRPGFFVHKASVASSALVEKAKDEKAFSQAADSLIPYAEKLTAALLKRFFENWQSEKFLVTSLKIERVRSISPGIDPIGKPDFYSNVEIEDRSYHTGTLIGSDDVDPQAFLPFSWFFSNWENGTPDSVSMQIEIMDDDAGLTFDDDPIDVSPQGRKLDFDYWPGTREVTGDIQSSAAGVVLAAGRGDDSGEVRFRIEHFPASSGAAGASCQVEGKVTSSAGTPAQGAFVFFRRLDSGLTRWQKVRVAEDGSYRIPNAKTGKYSFRPAGSGYDFTGVPKVVTLNLGVNRLSFGGGSRLSGPGIRASLGAVSPANRLGSSIKRQPPSNATMVADLPEIGSSLSQSALAVQVGPRFLGVVKNGLGYPDWTMVQVHLPRIVSSSTKSPLANAAGIRVVRQGGLQRRGDPTAILGGASFGSGAPNATVHATIWLGNEKTGYRKADEASVRTDIQGNASFKILAGTHVEEVTVDVEVTENPVNTWCKPKFRLGTPLLFRPSSSADDIGTQSAYHFDVGKAIPIDRNRSVRNALEAALFGRQGTASASNAIRDAAIEKLERERFRNQVSDRERRSGL